MVVTKVSIIISTKLLRVLSHISEFSQKAALSMEVV